MDITKILLQNCVTTEASQLTVPQTPQSTPRKTSLKVVQHKNLPTREHPIMLPINPCTLPLTPPPIGKGRCQDLHSLQTLARKMQVGSTQM
jgi:hypothetical protein